jgi:hypothetical protein
MRFGNLRAVVDHAIDNVVVGQMPRALPEEPAELPPAEPPPVEPPAGTAVTEPPAGTTAGGKGGSVLGVLTETGNKINVVLVMLSIPKIARDIDFFLHGDPHAPVGAQRVDSMGRVWTKVDESTWVTGAI